MAGRRGRRPGSCMACLELYLIDIADMGYHPSGKSGDWRRKVDDMRYLKLAVAGLLAMGASVSVPAATAAVKAGVAYQGAMLDNPDFRPGIGLNGSVGAERSLMGASGVGGLGLRANYEHYRQEGFDAVDQANLNEAGVAVTGMLGPNLARFQPRVGGHLGYARLDDNNFVEIGPDISAAYNVSPSVGIQAMVTPTWLANEDETEFHGTKVGLGVVWSAPGV
jgi:hypothetical protein